MTHTQHGGQRARERERSDFDSLAHITNTNIEVKGGRMVQHSGKRKKKQIFCILSPKKKQISEKKYRDLFEKAGGT